MEKQKERLEVLTEMVKQFGVVGERLNKMQQHNSCGELDPLLYAEYKTDLGKYTELDNRLKELTSDIDNSDKSEVQKQPTRGAFPPQASPQG